MSMRTPDPGLRTDDAEQWHRVHPLSPVVRGWLAVVAVILVFGRNFLEQTFSGAGREQSGISYLVAVLVIAAAVLVFGGVYVLSWAVTKYQVTDDHVRVNSGLLFRQQRQARLDRVQAIEVVQPLIARVLGLAELKFDVADAGNSAMRLSFLKLDEAERLRVAILARAAGVQRDEHEPNRVEAAPERTILTVSPWKILGTFFTSLGALLLVALLVALLVLLTLGHVGALAALVPMVLAVGATGYHAFDRNFNFRVAASPDGLRMHYGLTETRAQTIPPGRVQAVGISQSLIWRALGWYHVQVNVAGYGGQSREQRHTVLPVGSLSDVMNVLSLVAPDPGTDRPDELLTVALTGSRSAGGFVPAPRRAALLDPINYRRNGYRATSTVLLCRRGVLRRDLEVVPHERTQGLQLRQGPLQRRLRLVHFVLQSTQGPVKPLIAHMDVDDGRGLFLQQAARAARARRLAGPERWMERAGNEPTRMNSPSGSEEDQ